MLLELEPDPILFLKTYDRCSGEAKTHPVPFRHFGQQFVIVAWHEAEPYKQEWYLNLKEEPIVEIEIAGDEKFAVASTPTGAERLEILPLVEQLSCEVEKNLPRNVTGVLLTPMESTTHTKG